MQEARSKRETCLTNLLSSPGLGLKRLSGVPSITSKTVQEEGRILETVLKKGASVTILLRLWGVLNITKREVYAGKGGLCNNFTKTTNLY